MKENLFKYVKRNLSFLTISVSKEAQSCFFILLYLQIVLINNEILIRIKIKYISIGPHCLAWHFCRQSVNHSSLKNELEIVLSSLSKFH